MKTVGQGTLTQKPEIKYTPAPQNYGDLTMLCDITLLDFTIVIISKFLSNVWIELQAACHI